MPFIMVLGDVSIPWQLYLESVTMPLSLAMTQNQHSWMRLNPKTLDFSSSQSSKNGASPQLAWNRPSHPGKTWRLLWTWGGMILPCYSETQGQVIYVQAPLLLSSLTSGFLASWLHFSTWGAEVLGRYPVFSVLTSHLTDNWGQTGPSRNE